MKGLIFVTDGRRHLVCLPYSVPNLHAMAAELGIKRYWFHRDHYDIPKRRKAEIEAKCTIVGSRDVLAITQGVVTTFDQLKPRVFSPSKHRSPADIHPLDCPLCGVRMKKVSGMFRCEKCQYTPYQFGTGRLVALTRLEQHARAWDQEHPEQPKGRLDKPL